MDVDHGEGWQETVTVGEDISGEEKYKLHKEKKTWKEANETCVREGGHLVSILSLEEHKEVLDLVGKKHVWIGGRKKVEEPWHWSDGSKWNFTRWKHGRPVEKSWRCATLVSERWLDFWHCE